MTDKDRADLRQDRRDTTQVRMAKSIPPSHGGHKRAVEMAEVCRGALRERFANRLVYGRRATPYDSTP